MFNKEYDMNKGDVALIRKKIWMRGMKDIQWTYTSLNEYENMVKLFIEYRADDNIKEHYGVTLLVLIYNYRYEKPVRLLCHWC